MTNLGIPLPTLPFSKPKKREACVLVGRFYNIFEHSAPIACILDIPIVCDDLETIFLFKKFYPNLKCKLKSWTMPYLVENFSTIFYGFNTTDLTFKEMHQELIKKNPDNPTYKLPTKFIYHFHGCSDKRWFTANGHFKDVDQVLFYGQRMIDIFKELEIYEHVVSEGIVGNYRYAYYLHNQNFFDDLADKEIFSQFEKEQPTILYAPTWMDATRASSIFKAYKPIIENLPDHYNLLIKLHPNLSHQFEHYDPVPLYELFDKHSKKGNVVISPFFPCIYPLLKKCCAYLGDYSSVGYDALSFNLPMFFLNHDTRCLKTDKTAYLLNAGHNIYFNDFSRIFSIIEKHLPLDKKKFGEIRKKMYEYAFGKDQTYEKVQKKFRSFLT